MSRYVGEGSVEVLKLIAWLDLIGGIVGAIWIWNKFGENIKPGYSSITELNQIGIGIGFIVLAQGLIGCAFLLVIASIAENLFAVRQTLENNDISDSINELSLKISSMNSLFEKCVAVKKDQSIIDKNKNAASAEFQVGGAKASNITAACPNCKSQFKLKDDLQNKKVKCSVCGNVFRVKAGENFKI